MRRIDPESGLWHVEDIRARTHDPAWHVGPVDPVAREAWWEERIEIIGQVAVIERLKRRRSDDAAAEALARRIGLPPLDPGT